MARYLGDGPWDNAVCQGYCIMALERAGYGTEDIKKILAELTWCFDDTTTEEAGQHYRKGCYF